jgi:hypothetical protein
MILKGDRFAFGRLPLYRDICLPMGRATLPDAIYSEMPMPRPPWKGKHQLRDSRLHSRLDDIKQGEASVANTSSASIPSSLPFLAQFKAVLANWAYTDYVTATDLALDWAGRNLPAFSLKMLAKLMNDHVQAGGKIKRVREQRPHWDHYDYHYDFCLTWDGRRIYVESRLLDDDPNDPIIHIVNVHYA